MKNKIAGVIVGLSLIGGVMSASAQTSTNATSIESFFTTAYNWSTSFNTNSANSWTNGLNLEAAIGYEQVTGQGATSVADLQYDTGRWNVGGSIQYFGVGSSINVAEAQVGYAVVQKYDLEIETDIRAGYDFNTQDGIVEPAVFLKKKMTPNSFLKTGVSLPFEFKSTFQRNPTFFVETGFSL